MDEYIEREALLEDIENTLVFSGRPDRQNPKQMGARLVVQRIRCAPAADVAPVEHGRWVVKNGRIVCDHCEALMAVCPNRDVLEENLKYFNEKEKFCYNCGARMDGNC